ncbi:uracil phosphoribosyltransferase [Bacteroidia bacterium]|jgi:uracil phosphoribosyltransferase|nr:uracil phosphoribosyltransferase [bacterium]MDA9320029.1 uracil phosphoribosyltransferase [bacterium]MDC0105800.1 uracil phosphoribosyltransferase [Bacteroidia bacterium]
MVYFRSVIHILSKEFSLVSEFLRELRDKDIQQDRARFRKNIERIGQIAAYEISKKMKSDIHFTTTPLGVAKVKKLKEQPIVATILRAGLPLQRGINDMFDQADLAYISAYRKHTTDTEFEIVLEYVATPDINNRILIICDPMLATGQSLVQTYEAFLKKGKPSKVYLVSVIGSQQGVDYVTANIRNADLWIGVIDETLDESGYIVPGLGDAGDLSFGEKL